MQLIGFVSFVSHSGLTVLSAYNLVLPQYDMGNLTMYFHNMTWEI